MRRFDRYVLRQLAIGLAGACIGLALLVWLTQSLRFLELVLNRGLAFTVFLELTGLLLPNLITVILPIAAFGVVLFTYSRLASDRESVVMQGAGVPPLALARPALLLAAIAASLGWLLNLWIVPESHRAFREFQFEIRNRITAVLLEDGVFNQVGEGLTVYVRARDRDGTLRGILAHDAREKGAPVTYFADRGYISIGPAGPRATLVSGSRQEVDRASGRLQVLTFAESTLDMARAAGANETRYRDARERSLGELIDPPDRDQINPRDIGRFMVEAHQRFAQPIAGISLVLLAVATVLVSGFSRRGNAARIAIAVAIAAGLVALGVTVQNLAAREAALVPLIWVHAVAPGLVALWLLLAPSIVAGRGTTARAARPA
jgi:lipopolysaccharide export system permease protein